MLVGETLPIDMIKATVQIGEGELNKGSEDESEAFSLKISCPDKNIKRIAKQYKMDHIFVAWKESKYELGRLMFQ